MASDKAKPKKGTVTVESGGTELFSNLRVLAVIGITEDGSITANFGPGVLAGLQRAGEVHLFAGAVEQMMKKFREDFGERPS